MTVKVISHFKRKAMALGMNASLLIPFYFLMDSRKKETKAAICPFDILLVQVVRIGSIKVEAQGQFKYLTKYTMMDLCLRTCEYEVLY